MTSENRTEFKLKSPPTDQISTVQFSPNNAQFLMAASWDCKIRLYDTMNNTLLHTFGYKDSPYAILDCVMQSDSQAYTSGLDKTVRGYNFETQTPTMLGTHQEGVRCINYNTDRGYVVSGSWDRTIKVWDPRVAGRCMALANCQHEVYTMSIKDDLFVVGTSERRILVWDIRHMDVPLQTRDSLLKYQTRCLRVFPNKQGFVLSSIEGRVGVEYLDPSSEIQKKKYAFKCHRTKENDIECIYPVNAIAFHQEHSTFATGGSDGFVNIWDGFNKKRLCQFHRYPTGISSLAFSANGKILAIACSYLQELDVHPDPYPEDYIFIRNLTDQETKPK